MNVGVATLEVTARTIESDTLTLVLVAVGRG